jgi:Regulator of chromosome condensation (RCC1) repeat
MSGQRSADDGDVGSSGMAGGCAMREGDTGDNRRRSFQLPALTHHNHHNDGLAVFTWGRGEDGQLGLGDTADQDEPTYVRFNWIVGMWSVLVKFEFIVVLQLFIPFHKYIVISHIFTLNHSL